MLPASARSCRRLPAVLPDTLDAGQNTAAWKETENPMYRYAAYHLISSSHATGSIVVADTASSTSAATVLATLAEASYIEFQDIDGQLYINYDTLTQTGATWGEVTDLVCRNGVIHEVSTPLYIKAPTNVPTTTFEVTDFSILETEATATAAHILFDRGLPGSAQGSVGTHSANGLVHSLIVQAGTLSIAAIGHGPILPNAEIPGCFHCIDVGPQEQELPAILALLVFDHLFDLVYIHSLIK